MAEPSSGSWLVVSETEFQDLSNGSAGAKSTVCSSRQPGFDSRYPHSSSHPICNSSSKVSDTLT